MAKTSKPPTPKPRDSSDEPVDRTPLNVTLPPIDAEPEEIAQALFQRPPLKKPSAEDAGESQKVCPECGHVFQGNGWDGVDAHWRSKHEDIMPYEEAWPLLRDGKYTAQAPAISN